mmetsp:Transcript_3294/g.7710  ORF Transcript_3294/g.7710 Transcript_3294/m.7710 type:complete len:666 (-) Transcript_3294:382-2379(-)
MPQNEDDCVLGVVHSPNLPAPPSYNEALNDDDDDEDDNVISEIRNRISPKTNEAKNKTQIYGKDKKKREKTKTQDTETDDDFEDTTRSMGSDFDHVISFGSRKQRRQSSILNGLATGHRHKSPNDIGVSGSDLVFEAKVDGISISNTPTPSSARSVGTGVSDNEFAADTKYAFAAPKRIEPIDELSSGSVKISCPFCSDGQIVYDGVEESTTCNECAARAHHARPTNSPKHPPRNPEDEIVQKWQDSKICDKDIEVKIILDADTVCPLKNVSGRVSFQVLKKTKVQCVKVAFIGFEHFKIYSKAKGANVIKKRIFVMRKVLFKSSSFWNNVEKMKESFPFVFKVPGYSPPSLSYGNREGCWIDYRIRVAVLKPGSKKLKTESLVQVIPAAVHPQEGPNAKNMKQVTEENKISFGGFGCFAGGHLRLKVRLARTCFAKSERMIVPMVVEILNLTDARITRFSLELIQTVLFLKKKLFSNHTLAAFKSKKCFGKKPTGHNLTTMLMVDFPLQDAIPNMESRNILVKHCLKAVLRTGVPERELVVEFPIIVERDFDDYQTHQYTSAFQSLKEKAAADNRRGRGRSELFEPLDNTSIPPKGYNAAAKDRRKAGGWHNRRLSASSTWTKGMVLAANADPVEQDHGDTKKSIKSNATLSHRRLLARTWTGK